jgi:hypothetical protein
LLDDAPAIWLIEPIAVGAVNRRVVLPPLRQDAWWASIPAWRVTGQDAAGAADTARYTP